MITLESILKRGSIAKDAINHANKVFESINKWVFDGDKQSRDFVKNSFEKMPRIPWDSRTYFNRLNKTAADIMKKGHELLVVNYSQPFFTIIVCKNDKFYKYYALEKKREWVMDSFQQERGGSDIPNIDKPDCWLLPEGTLKILNELI